MIPNTPSTRCICAEIGYCADVPSDPKACPVCRTLGQYDECSSEDLPTTLARILGCEPDDLRPARREIVRGEA